VRLHGINSKIKPRYAKDLIFVGPCWALNALHKLIPQAFVRWCGRNGEWHFLDRMLKSDGARVQRNATVFIGTFSPIFKVAFNVATYACQLCSDLVMTSGLQVDFQKVVVGKAQD